MIIYKIGTYDADSLARVEALLKDVEGGTSVDFVVGVGTHSAGAACGRARRKSAP